METPLKKIRLSRGLTLQEVATAVGIDNGSLSRIEQGKQRSPDSAEKLVNYYGRASITELEILYPERYLKPAELPAAVLAGGAGG